MDRQGVVAPRSKPSSPADHRALNFDMGSGPLVPWSVMIASMATKGVREATLRGLRAQQGWGRIASSTSRILKELLEA
jgi:hypothetical protein